MPHQRIPEVIANIQDSKREINFDKFPPYEPSNEATPPEEQGKSHAPQGEAVWNYHASGASHWNHLFLWVGAMENGNKMSPPWNMEWLNEMCPPANKD